MAEASSSSSGERGNLPPSMPDSPTSVGFNTDQLPPNTSRTSENYSDEDEAAVDPNVLPEEADQVEEGEDLFNDNYMDDYRRMDDHDQYESVGLDESLEDERDLDQIMADRRAAELELEARDGHCKLKDSDSEVEIGESSDRCGRKQPCEGGGGRGMTKL